jgi:hypothetical protein
LQSRIVSIANRIERVSHEIDATGLLALLALMLHVQISQRSGPRAHRGRSDMLVSHVIFVHTWRDRSLIVRKTPP